MVLLSRRRAARALGVIVLGASGLTPAMALAQRAPTSVVVWTHGPDAEQARAEIAGALGPDAHAVDAGAWRDAFRLAGPPESLARDLARPRSRPAALERARHAAERAGVDEVVLVTTSRDKAGRHADAYLIVPGRDPETLRNVPFGVPAGGLGLTVHDKIAAAHPAPVADAPAPAEPRSATPEPSSPTLLAAPPSPPGADTATADPSRRSRHEVARELFELAAGVGVGARNFSFHDPYTTSNLRSYQLGAAPLLGVDAALYPLTDLGVPVLSDLGIVGSYAQAVAVGSAAPGSGTVGTQWDRWQVGGRFRFRTGGPGAPVLGVVGAYGSDAFTFQGADPTGTYPSVTYDFVQASGDVRVPLGRFSVTARGGYLGVLSAGEVASRFPRASVAGVDFGVGGGFDVGAGFEARLEATYRRFFYSMNTRPGDVYVAGGALDELWGAQAKVAYVF